MIENNQYPGEEKDKNLSTKDSERDDSRFKTYTDDDTVNEDMKAGNPTGIAENEEGHWSDADDDDEDEKERFTGTTE